MATMFNTQFNFEFMPNMAEPKSKLPSMTQPDMSYTVQDMINRFTRGGIVPVSLNDSYDEEDDINSWFIDPTRSADFDLSDIPAMQQELSDIQYRLEQEKARLAAEQAKTQQAAQQAQQGEPVK